MTLSFACICGANYDIEFEPVDGQLPGEVRCPQCGADATAIAKRKLAQALANAPPPEKPGKPAPVEEKPAVPTACARHPRAPVQMLCLVCRRPMCTACMEQYGFVCSTYCRERADELRLPIPAYEHQRRHAAEPKSRTGTVIGIGIGLMVVALIGVWIWYVTSATRPHVEFRLRLADDDRPVDGRFIGPHQILLTTTHEVMLYDVESGRKLWSTTLPANPAATNDDIPGYLVHLSDSYVWIGTPGLVLRLDRQTGQVKGRYQVPGIIRGIIPATTSATIISQDADTTRLEQIAVQDGSVTTNLSAAHPAAATVAPVAADAETPSPRLDPVRTDFIPAGPDFVELEARLIKPNIVEQATMKKESSPGVSDEVRLTETAAFREDVLNDIQRQRTGGIRKVDESTYAVRLHRLFEPTAADWTGELAGRPVFFALTTVDVLLAGQEFVVFDKSNQPLWSGKLPYPAAQRFVDGAPRSRPVAPCLEAGGILYFFDQGVLTAYELKTGAVRWRIPSVGITKLEFDSKGLLYVSGTTAGLDSIQYADQVDLRDKIIPVILKVDPASGKILWQSQQVGDTTDTSGPFLYFTRAQGSTLDGLVSSTARTAEHFRVHRIDPRNGRDLWEYYQPGPPVAIDFQGTRILLVDRDGVKVLKYFSF